MRKIISDENVGMVSCSFVCLCCEITPCFLVLNHPYIPLYFDFSTLCWSNPPFFARDYSMPRSVASAHILLLRPVPPSRWSRCLGYRSPAPRPRGGLNLRLYLVYCDSIASTITLFMPLRHHGPFLVDRRKATQYERLVLAAPDSTDSSVTIS